MPTWGWTTLVDTRSATNDELAPDCLRVALLALAGCGAGGRAGAGPAGGVAPLPRGAQLLITVALPFPPDHPTILTVGPFPADLAALASDGGQPLAPGTAASSSSAAPPPSRRGVAEAPASAALGGVPGSVALLQAALRRTSSGPLGAKALIRAAERRPAVVDRKSVV